MKQGNTEDNLMEEDREDMEEYRYISEGNTEKMVKIETQGAE